MALFYTVILAHGLRSELQTTYFGAVTTDRIHAQIGGAIMEHFSLSRPWNYASWRIFLLIVGVFLAGCATSMQDMKLSQDELDELSPKEGIVVGSLLIRGGKDFLGRTKFKLIAKNIDKSGIFTRPKLSLQAHRNGDEEIFVSKLPAGSYRFLSFYQPGFSTFAWKINIKFQVQPGKKVYVGRLIFDFPKDETITIWSQIRIMIEDAKDVTLSDANSKYNIKLNDLTKNLMISFYLQCSFFTSRAACSAHR